MQGKHQIGWIVLVVFSLALVACAPPATPTAAPAATLPPTATATATLAPSPTPTIPAPTVTPTVAPSPSSTPEPTAIPTPAAKEILVGVSQATNVVFDFNTKDAKGYTTATTLDAKPSTELTLVVEKGKYVTFQGFVQVKTADNKVGFVPQDTLSQLPKLDDKNSQELNWKSVQEQLKIPSLTKYGVSAETSPASIQQWIDKENGRYAFQNNDPGGKEAYDLLVSGRLISIDHDQQGNLVFKIQGKDPTDIRTVIMTINPDRPMSFQTNDHRNISSFLTAHNWQMAELAIKTLKNEYDQIVGENKGIVAVGSTNEKYSKRSGGYWGLIDFSR